MYELTEENRQQLMMRSTECLDDVSPIQHKIKLARKLHIKWEVAIRQDPDINSLLRKLKRFIKISQQAMHAFGVADACKRCDEEEGGSCCGAGLENKFDVLLLLMNLLLGVSLPNDRLRPGSCYLLTETGCMLKVRLVLCVDFLCPKIVNALTHDQLIKLQTVSGDELVTSFILYDAIKKFIRRSAWYSVSS
ncbi:MAG: hypothetical protein JSU72_13765 [Deltaproteobacteria bacterium]|nr:MAG: hypothetical protein JSU72_13765 [Deltaproteobacteria bacterium]